VKPSELHFEGNKELLNYPKTAFFCSRKCPSAVISKTYDWAIEQKNKGNCVISGFHSQIERDVLHFLLKGEQPIIMALARSLYKRLPNRELKEGLEKGNLLIVSSFKESIKRASSRTAQKRNELMIELTDDIMVAFASPKGAIAKLVPKMKASRKLLYTIESRKNNKLQVKGFSPYGV
jgi:predicted Rossmann fold nucleotide-binding protein DprA/Smf involved in DNA uptake